jgi:TonB family protein
MTELILCTKCTLVLLAAALSCRLMRGQSAAARRTVWLAGLSATLLLPFGAWLPKTPLSIPTIVVSATQPASNGAAGTASVDWISLLWIAGSVICLIRLLLGIYCTTRLIREGATRTEGAFDIVTVSRLPGPAAWGIGRKLMLLPDCAGDWPEQRRRMVLLHEHAHLVRNDSWALLIAEVACAVYWMNPLMWFAAAQMRREQEHAADDEVLNSGADPAEYAGHLVAIARAARSPMLTAGAVHQSDLGVRVKAILDQRRVRTMAPRKTLFAYAAFLFALTLPLASMQAQRKIYSVKDAGVTAPRLLHKQEPDYTQEAKDAKIQGPVTLSAVIDIDGKAHDIEVERGLDTGLDANAVAAIETWRFEPAQKAGEPVPVAVKIEVNFRLK